MKQKIFRLTKKKKFKERRQFDSDQYHHLLILNNINLQNAYKTSTNAILEDGKLV